FNGCATSRTCRAGPRRPVAPKSCPSSAVSQNRSEAGGGGWGLGPRGWRLGAGGWGRAVGGSLPRPLARRSDLLFPVPRLGGRRQRVNKPLRGGGHFIDRAVEHHFVRAGWTIHPAEFSDELERRRSNLVVSRRWREVRERLDVSAHG